MRFIHDSSYKQAVSEKKRAPSLGVEVGAHWRGLQEQATQGQTGGPASRVAAQLGLLLLRHFCDLKKVATEINDSRVWQGAWLRGRAPA